MDQLTVAFDADDTLWHNENAFAQTEQRFAQLMAPWADPEVAYQTLVEHERRRLKTYGYGVKSFGLSMVETACSISGGAIPADDIKTITDWAVELLEMPTVLIDGAVDAVKNAASDHDVMMITKGDPHHQLRRLENVGIADLFFDIEVVPEKDAATYDRVLRRHRIDPARFVMVGNSMVSDVIPLVELGARAIHVPYHVTWALESTDAVPDDDTLWRRIDELSELPEAIESFGVAGQAAEAVGAGVEARECR